MTEHTLKSEMRVGDPIYGIPDWQVNENGYPTGEVLPSRSKNASQTCSCGYMFVAPTDDGARRAFLRHVRETRQLT